MQIRVRLLHGIEHTLQVFPQATRGESSMRYTWPEYLRMLFVKKTTGRVNRPTACASSGPGHRTACSASPPPGTMGRREFDPNDKPLLDGAVRERLVRGARRGSRLMDGGEA